jgi:undecaprenyl-diphosphatase
MSDLPTRERAHPLLQRHRLALGTALGFLAVALGLLVVMAFDAGKDAVQPVDDAVRDGFRSAQWTPLTWLAEFLAFVGSWYFTWPLRLAVTGFLWLRRRWEALVAWILAIAVYEPLVGILKSLYGRDRPPLADDVTGFSFPSGHAVVGAAVAIGLGIVLVPAGPRRRYYEVLAGWFALFMALSRVYLDAHWFTDVLTGTAIGAAVMIGVPAIVHEVGDRLHLRRVGRSRP